MRYLLAWAFAAVGCLLAFSGYRQDRMWVWLVGWSCMCEAVMIVLDFVHLRVCP